MFHLFMMMFVCFPCGESAFHVLEPPLLSCVCFTAGNFGILVGFVCAIPMFVAFVLILVCTNEPVAVNLVGNQFVQGMAVLHHANSDPDYHKLDTQEPVGHTSNAEMKSQDKRGGKLKVPENQK